MSLLRRSSGPAAGSEPPPTVVVAVEAHAGVDEACERVDTGRFGALARAVLAGEGVRGPAELSLAFVDEATIAALNREWMGEDGPTDVLSFPIDGAETGPGPEAAPALLGDVVVCPAVARRYADRHGRRPEDELALLVVHGVLHVLGHDHAAVEDEAAMQAREDHHLRLHHDPAWARSTS